MWITGVSVKPCMYFSHMDAIHDEIKAKKMSVCLLSKRFFLHEGMECK